MGRNTYKPKFDIGDKVQTKSSGLTGIISKINIRSNRDLSYDIRDNDKRYIYRNIPEEDLISISKYKEDDLVYLMHHDTLYQGIIFNIITLEDQSIRYYVRILEDGQYYYNKCCLPEELFDNPEFIIENLKNNIILWNPDTK